MCTPSWRMKMSNALSRVKKKNGLPLSCVILEDTELEALGYFPSHSS